MAETAYFMVHRAPPYEETGNGRRIAEMSKEIAAIRHHGKRSEIAFFPNDVG